MPKRTKLLLMTLCAVVACSFAAGSASANRSLQLEGVPAGGGVQGEGVLTFVGTEGELSREITCDITLLRTIARHIPKIRGTLIGKVTGILVDRGETARSPHCRHGSFIREVHDIMPLNCTHSESGGGVLRWDCSGAPAGLWKLIYDSFQGTLPRTEGTNVHIKGLQFRIVLLEIFGGTLECLYEGETFGLIAIVRETGVIRSFRAIRALTALTRISGGASCPARGTFEGNFNIRPNLTIRLL